MTPLPAFLRLLRLAPAGQITALLALMVLAGLSEGVGVLLLVPLLDALQTHQAGGNPIATALLASIARLGLPPSPGGILAAFVLLVLLRNAIQYGREMLASRLQHHLVDDLRARCFRALLGAEWRWLAAGRASDHANLLLTDVNRVGIGLNSGLGLLAGLATMLAYLATAFLLSWPIALLALASGGLILAALSGQRRQAFRLGSDLGQANRAIQGTVQDSLAGIKLAKILGSETRHLDFFAATVAALRQRQIEFMAGASRARAVYQSAGATLLAAYLYLGIEVLHTPMAELLTLVLVFGRLIPLFASAQQLHHHWLHAMPALAETERLLEACRTAAEPAGTDDGRPWPLAQAVCLDRVTVRYPGRERPALDDFSARFPARTTTAVMGASGAGKSTLADVLMGLLDVDGGRLTVDGETVAGPLRRRWRQAVAYVPQETFLFNDSIRGNLLWGRPDAGEADLNEALRHAAADFVFDLPRGLDTPVGDGGVRLSGGERQRLALARALLKRPSMLILDEATSALDLDNEARVRSAIEHLHGDLTVVVIGHRPATLEHADQVLVLDAGRIAAQGTWAEIRRHGGGHGESAAA